MLWKGHSSDYDIADIKREGSSSDYAVKKLGGKYHFFLRFCTRKRSKTYVISSTGDMFALGQLQCDVIRYSIIKCDCQNQTEIGANLEIGLIIGTDNLVSGKYVVNF